MNPELHHINDELLVNMLLGECSPQEAEQVRQWLQESEANRKRFEEFNRVWEESKKLALDPGAVDPDEAWLRLRARMQGPSKGLRINRLLFFAAAAILLLLGMILLWQSVTRQPFSKAPAPMAMQQKFIQAGSLARTDTLSDRSVVTLNRHSELRYPEAFAKHERRVQLRGEAFFSITPDKRKPFFIDAGNHVEIRVVGTSFNVKAYDEYTEVVVETGIVEIRQFNRVMLLHPRDKARIGRDDSTIVVQKNRDRLYTYYRSKEFECDNTPLWKVVEVLNEAYDDSVVISRDELKRLTLTTRFDNESLETILDIIGETFELTIEKKGRIYYIK